MRFFHFAWVAASGLLADVIAKDDEKCMLHLGERSNNDTRRHRRLVTVSLPESCEKNEIVGIDDPIDGIMKKFKMVKSIPRGERKGHGRHMLARYDEEEEEDDDFGYWYGEDEEDGSTFNYVQDASGNMFGSMVDMTKDAVMQFLIEDGQPVVIITNSSAFGEEIHPEEIGHSYVEDKKDSHVHDSRKLISEIPKDASEKSKSISSTSHLRKNASRSLYEYDDSGKNIDIVVVWTKAAECAHFGLAPDCVPNKLTYIAMQNLVKLAAEETNTAYELSGVNTELLVVHGYRHPTFDENNYSSFSAMLTDLKIGKVDGVHEARETYGGDLVSLLVNDPRYCGVGYVGPSKAWMFSVVSWNCAVGYFSFGHEVGHNLGLEHDRGSARSCGDRQNYNYGYRDPQARFRSILAYGCKTGQCDNNPGTGYCTRVQRFSNPDTGFNGLPIGSATENNARKLNEVKAVVAKYFPHKKRTKQPTPAPKPTKSPTKSPTLSPTELPTKSPVDPTKSPTNLPTHQPSVFDVARHNFEDPENPIEIVGQNVALFKPTWQSSTINGAKSSRAVDGITDGDFEGGSVTETKVSTNPSWSVLLMSDYVIHAIKIYNRSDCCGARLAGFKVVLWKGMSESFTYQHDDSEPGPVTTIAVPAKLANRVEVIIPGTGKALSLAEVQIFGTPPGPPTWAPTKAPKAPRTTSPTKSPTSSPTTSPTKVPTATPTSPPTKAFTSSPTGVPTKARTASPTSAPTKSLTSSPTGVPTKARTTSPTKAPISTLKSIQNEFVDDIETNVALGKPTYQTSTRYGADSSRAVDGNTDGDFEHGSVTHTLHSTDPTLGVHFLSTYKINSIKLYNRIDCCSERLRGFKLTLFNDNEEVWTHLRRGPKPGVLTEVDVPAVIADRLEISIPGNFMVLSLAEVEVYGNAKVANGVLADDSQTSNKLTPSPTLAPVAPTGQLTTSPTRSVLSTNVALGKPTYQTSTRYGADSSRAVDGNTDGDFEHGSVTHTLHSTDPTWSVDFLSAYEINSIMLYNRIDCCSERLRGFKLTLFNDNEEVWTHLRRGPKPGVLTEVDVPAVMADRLEISIPGNFMVLSLAEVEVYGIPPVNTLQMDADEAQSQMQMQMQIQTGSPTSAPVTSVLHNVAYHKPTQQSQTVYGADSSRAVDGDINGYMGNNTVTHTHSMTDPKWSVDLIDKYNIKQVKVYNRVDCCMYRLAGFKLVIKKDNEQVWMYTQSGESPGELTIIDVPSIVGDSVEIIVPGHHKVLSLAEVEVFASTIAR